MQGDRALATQDFVTWLAKKAVMACTKKLIITTATLATLQDEQKTHAVTNAISLASASFDTGSSIGSRIVNKNIAGAAYDAAVYGIGLALNPWLNKYFVKASKKVLEFCGYPIEETAQKTA